MTWPGIDYHNHICGAPIEAMVARASSRGVREFGITEHVFMLHEGQPIFPTQEEDGTRCSCDAYVTSVRAQELATPGMVVRLGLEVDFVPGTEDTLVPLLESVEWDYLMGSVHEIDGVDLFDRVPSTQQEGESLWRRYYELVAEAIESGMFDVITHPVRNAERNPFVPDNLDSVLDQIAAFATFHGVALELNGYDTVTWPHLVERLANACGRTGCVISLGSDAHTPDEVTQGLTTATQLAIAGGVKSVITAHRRERRLVAL